MESTVAGALVALAASSLFSAGLVLQATETQSADQRLSLRPSLIGALLRRRRWVLGAVVTFAGYPFHVAALLLASITVVQPALATGLLVLLVMGARVPGQSVGAREIAGVTAIVGGVAAVALTAPARAAVQTQHAPLVFALLGLAAVTVSPYVLTRLRAPTGAALATTATFAAGTAYAFSGITTKLAADQLAHGTPAAMIGWLVVTAIVGGLGFLSQVTALQYRSATQVGPVIYVIPVLVPVLLAPFLTGEGWSHTPFAGWALIASLLVVCAGAALVSASASVASITKHEAPDPAR